MKLLIWGIKGKMGDLIRATAAQDPFWTKIEGVDTNHPVEALTEVPQVVIDFSHPSALPQVLDYCLKHRLPLVMGTTGLNTEELAKVEEASKLIPVLQTTNMSLGMNLMFSLVEQVASRLKGTVDIEVVEAHHNRKKDAPSGSAVTIVESIEKGLGAPAKHQYGRVGQCPREKGEIGIHALRGGNIVGLHEAHFINEMETLKIVHEAHDRGVFAQGALAAAKYLLHQGPGRYHMRDVLGL